MAEWGQRHRRAERDLLHFHPQLRAEEVAAAKQPMLEAMAELAEFSVIVIGDKQMAEQGPLGTEKMVLPLK